MARDTGSAGTLSEVSVMGGGVVLRSRMALPTHGITLSYQLITMGVVTVAADHAGLVHFALDKRTIDVDFIANLAIWPIQGRVDER